MATRNVELRVTSTGFDDVLAKLDQIAEKIDSITAKLDELSRKVVSPDVQVKGIDESDTKLDDLTRKLDEVGKKHVTADVDVKVDDHKLEETLKDVRNKIKGVFGIGDGGSGGGALGAVSGAGGEGGKAGGGIFAGALTNPYTAAGIGGLVAYAMGLAPGVIPSALGLGVGGLGALGGYKIDPKAFQSVGKDFESEFLNSLTQQQMRPVAGPGKTGETGIPGTSFMEGLLKILQQLDQFSHDIEPNLALMFQASLPFLEMFEQVFTKLATMSMPIFTQVMQEMKPYLPQIEAGFMALGQALLFFIKDLGPGMKDGAIVFEATCIAIKGIMIGLAYVCDFLAEAFVKVAEFSQRAVDDMREGWDTLSSQAKRFAHDIEVAWDAVYSFVSGGAARTVAHTMESIWDSSLSYVVGSFRKFGSLIEGSFVKTYEQFVNFGRDIINGIIRGIESALGALENLLDHVAHDIINNPITRFFGINSPSTLMFSHGENLMRGLAGGIDSGAGGVNSAMQRVQQTITPGGYGSPALAGTAGHPLNIQLEWTGGDFGTFLKKYIRVHGGDVNVVGR